MSSDNGGSNQDDGDGDKKQLPLNDAVVRELSLMFEPIATSIKSADEGNTKPMRQLFEDVGVANAVEHAQSGPLYDTLMGSVKIANSLVAVAEAIYKYDTFWEALANKPELLPEAIQGIKGIVETIIGLTDLEAGKVDYDDLGEAFLDTLIVKYLSKHQPIAYNLARVAGYIVERPDKHDEVKLEEIGRLLGDPTSVPAEVFGWGTDELETMVILQYLAVFFREFEFPLPGANYKLDLPAKIEPATDLDPPGNARKQLDVPLASQESGSVMADTGFEIVPMPGTGNKLPGLAVVPYGKALAQDKWDLGGNWEFRAGGMGAFEHWGPVFRPESQVEFRNIGDQTKDVPGELHGIAEVIYKGGGSQESEDSTTLVGDPDGSRLSVSRASLYTQFNYDGDEMVFTVGLPAKGTIGVHPKDFDGFLRKVMPEDGIFHQFDTELGWATDEGLYLGNGSTTEVSIPQNASIGPVDLQEIYLAAEPPGGFSADVDDGTPEAEVEGTITITAAASASVELGPVTATVKRMGVEAEVGFPEDRDGNLGFMNIEMDGFSPPSGAGISFEAGPVSGGGYLEFDPDRERYAGVLQLKTSKLTINAVGLLTTELPGGKDGFSLLLIISGEFPPVQLGMGFTLNGVGGLIGVNRSIKQDPLAKAVRAGSVDSLLFPENPVANSQRIISDLRSIFPPTEDIHVVGPMAKLGYGGGSMITIDIGILLSIPTWKIVLLGKMSTALPDEKTGMIELNLAVRGLLDIPNKRVAIDASLYDSRIVAFTVSGDMALRSNWGDKPRFVMSFGGWNPRFDPPSDFPALDRMKASMGEKGGNFRLELKAYLAVTSNTFQVGASVFAKAEIGPLGAKGKLAFDALFEFNPFKFVIDFLAKFSITFKGKGLSVKLDGTLMGPGPFRIKGTVSFELLMISVKKDIDVTIGPSKSKEELPRARILPELTEELGKPVNWKAQLPAEGPEVATFRDVETGEKEVLAHPMGAIGVRQTVVPLDYDIEKFGKARPAGYTTFTIEGVSVSGSASVTLSAKTKEDFAPAKYQQMSDSEKLDSEAFEQLTAGRQMAHEGVYCGYEAGTQSKNVRKAEFTYECTVIDRPRNNWGTALDDMGKFASENFDATSALPAAAGNALSNVSASAQSPVRQAGGQRFRLSEADKGMFDAQAGGLASEIDVAEDVEMDTEPSLGQQVVRGGDDPDVGGLSGSVSMNQTTYTVARAGDLQEVDVGAEGGMTKSEAQRELRTVRAENPETAKQLRVVERRKAQSGQMAATDGGEDA